MTTPVSGRTLQMVAGLVPATLVVLFGGIVALLALALDDSRRQYALDLADRFVNLAAVLVGNTRLTPLQTAAKAVPPSRPTSSALPPP